MSEISTIMIAEGGFRNHAKIAEKSIKTCDWASIKAQPAKLSRFWSCATGRRG